MMPSPTAPPLFAFDDVSVEIDGHYALRHVSTTIPSAGITAILGPSGSGKTTLLRLCNRLTVPTSGSVFYRGTSLDQLDPLALRREVGMVFQQPAPFPGTVRENFVIAVGDADQPAMAAVLERVHLDRSFLSRPAQELSVGEAQRVCMARTLLTEPAVLLLDEPTSALDVESRLAIERLVQRLAGEGVAVVWVTHDLEQASRVATGSIVLIDGRLGSEAEARAFRGDEPAPRAKGVSRGGH